MKPISCPVTLGDLEAAHRKVAILLTRNDAYLPIFTRLEAELIVARADSDPIAKARAIMERQRAMA